MRSAFALLVSSRLREIDWFDPCSIPLGVSQEISNEVFVRTNDSLTRYPALALEGTQLQVILRAKRRG